MFYDYYAILNTSHGSSLEHIRKCYCKLALATHPERAKFPYHPAVPPAMASFVEHLPALTVDTFWQLLGEAYEVLTNDLLRSIYDAHGIGALQNGIHTNIEYIPPYKYHGNAMETFQNAMSTCHYSPLVNSFDQQFEAETPATEIQMQKDANIEKILYVSLDDVYFGAVKQVNFRRHEFIDSVQRNATALKSVTLEVPVPKGCASGTRIRVFNAGDRCWNRIPADVVFKTVDWPHDTYERHGSDLIKMEQIDLWQALCGFQIQVDTIDRRKFNVAIHDIVDESFVKIIPDEGLPLPNDESRRGNLLIKFKIIYPKKIEDLISDIQKNKMLKNCEI